MIPVIMKPKPMIICLINMCYYSLVIKINCNEILEWKFIIFVLNNKGYKNHDLNDFINCWVDILALSSIYNLVLSIYSSLWNEAITS